jgi:carboxyl-terminal processing protease
MDKKINGCVRMKIRAMRCFSLLLILTVIVMISGCTMVQEEKYPEEDEQIAFLLELIEQRSFYYDGELVTKEMLLEGALRGMVETLGDPYSTYFDEEALADFYSQVQANFVGIGVSIIQTGNYSVIAGLIPNSPAASSGLQVGDVIIKVDDQAVKGFTTSEIANAIKGPADTVRKVTVARGSLTDLKSFNITLKQVNNPTVDYELIVEEDETIGYLTISNFASNTFEEFKAAIEQLNQSNLTDLIIDVRNNPGGYLHVVLNMMDYLLDTDDALMYIQDRDDKVHALKQNKFNSDVDYKVLILMNEGSASASEIFSATLNELAGYELIGKTTYGKGTVQTTIPLNEAGTIAVKLTIENWLTPHKNWIQDAGVAPTHEVDWSTGSNLAYLDYETTIAFDTVNSAAVKVQSFLNMNGANIREDGYIDQKTIDALTAYQTELKTLHNITVSQLGQLDFKTIYYMNKELITLSNDLTIDDQYQYALDLAMNN